MTFKNFSSIENLFNAWKTFCKGKRSKVDVANTQRHLEEVVFSLHEELRAGRYRHNSYEQFTIHDPKQRTIHKACVKDRIVHQALIQVIEPIFENRFIYDSYSCRKNKGTHAAVRRLKKFGCTLSENNSKTVHVLKCDIKRFFAHVDHVILFRLLSERIEDIGLKKIILQIIEGFGQSIGKGIPLGNLTSQLFANVYLHELDRFIKQQLLEKYYIRYCDDFLILHQDSKHLSMIVSKIDLFLKENLGLTLHPNKINKRTLSQGIDFLGYVTLKNATVVRTMNKKRMLQRATSMNISSYVGLCSYADAYLLSKEIINRAYL